MEVEHLFFTQCGQRQFFLLGQCSVGISWFLPSLKDTTQSRCCLFPAPYGSYFLLFPPFYIFPQLTPAFVTVILFALPLTCVIFVFLPMLLHIWKHVSGTKGKTKKITLGSWRNDFEAGHTDEYTVQAMDVGEILVIQLHNDGSILLTTSDWFVNKIVVASSTQEKAFQFPCYRWVVSDMVIFQGKGILTCHK